MARPVRQTLFLVITIIFLLGACTPVQSKPNSGQIVDQAAPTTTLTIATQPSITTVTNTPPPTQTEAVSPTAPPASPTVIPPTAKPDYACDIINQGPIGDTKFHRNDSFDIEWTIVNTGTQRWEEGTYLEYQSGPELTEKIPVELPKLWPGDEYEVTLDAVAPAKTGRQIMVWVIKGPGTVSSQMNWMCYPYTRIIVEK